MGSIGQSVPASNSRLEFPEFKGRNLAFRGAVSFNALYESPETTWQTTTGGHRHSVRCHLGGRTGDVAIRIRSSGLPTYSGRRAAL